MEFNMKFLTFVFALIVSMTSFAMSKPPAPTPVATATPVPASTPMPPAAGFVPLSWEKGHPERKAWSDHTFKIIAELLPTFDQAEDAERFCPKYHSLTVDQRVNAWGEMFSATAKFESNWNPATQYTESTMGTDPITGRQVVSEGLLQLSYQDITWAKFCAFDWAKDKNLPLAQRSITNPLLNLDCGIRIMDRQMKKYKRAIIRANVYWAVLRDGGRYQKIAEITAMVKKLPFCQ
jgi:hypothetical protein